LTSAIDDQTWIEIPNPRVAISRRRCHFRRLDAQPAATSPANFRTEIKTLQENNRVANVKNPRQWLHVGAESPLHDFHG
jgi:hypothetical protein